MASVVSTVRLWSEMVKLSHSVFALPFALIAAFLAGRNLPGRSLPYPGQLGLIIVCMVGARSAAMTFNRIVDAGIDARNPRTASRALPAGRLRPSVAWTMLGVACVTFGAGCLGFYLFYANAWPVLLAGPVLVYLCAYSLTKRFTRLSHLYLGTALALSPLAAWVAIHPSSVGVPVVTLMVAVTCWVGGFDIIYACQDIECDRREGLYSLPARMGPAKALWIARAAHVLVLLALIVLGLAAELGLLYGIGVAITAALLLFENTLVRPGDYTKVNVAFFTLNGVVSLVLAAAAITDVVVAAGSGR